MVLNWLKPRCPHSCLSSGGSRGESISWPFPAPRSHLHSLARSVFLHFQRASLGLLLPQSHLLLLILILLFPLVRALWWHWAHPHNPGQSLRRILNRPAKPLLSQKVAYSRVPGIRTWTSLGWSSPQSSCNIANPMRTFKHKEVNSLPRAASLD